MRRARRRGNLGLTVSPSFSSGYTAAMPSSMQTTIEHGLDLSMGPSPLTMQTLQSSAYQMPAPSAIPMFDNTPSLQPTVEAAPTPTVIEPVAIPLFFPTGTQPPTVVDTTGEVVSETTAPLPGSPGGPSTSPYVSDINPAVAAPREAWKTWLPIGLVVAGIAGAVWILRKK